MAASSSAPRCPYMGGCPSTYSVCPVPPGGGTPLPPAQLRPCDPTNQIPKAEYDLLAADVAFDDATLQRYVPTRPSFFPDPPFPPQYQTPPGVYPWNTNVIPYEINQAPEGVPPATPNSDGYDKFQSVSYVLAYYVAIDIATIAPNDEKVTLFLANLADRGDHNYRKKVYMWALTCDKMEKYKPKMELFLNNVYSQITIHGKPVLSTFQRELVLFFLNIHFGADDYPEYLVTYFQYFMEITGAGLADNPRSLSNCDWVRKMVYGYQTTPKVREYIRERAIAVEENQDDISIIFYWQQAGMPVETILTECIHNIIAFNQFTNTLYLLVVDRINGTPVPPNPPAPPVPPIVYNFLAAYTAAAGNSALQLNILREVYRLLVPNSISFSRLVEAVPSTTSPVKVNHIHKAIMIQQTGAAYFAFNPARYDPAFTTDFSACNPPVVPGNPPNPVFDPSTYFVNSAVDGETVLPLSSPTLFPVFPVVAGATSYYPFGFGYRRCAGEVLNYFLGLMMLEKFQLLFNAPELAGATRFRFDPPTGALVTPAPFTFVPDNIFVNPLPVAP